MDGRTEALLGHLDLVGPDLIEGWAYDPADPNGTVALRILDNGRTIAELKAEGPRPGLLAAGIGTGFNAFSFEPPGGLKPGERHVIHVQRASDGRDIPNSPWILEVEEAEPGPAEPASFPMTVPVIRDDTCQGHLDIADRRTVEGWALDTADPDTPVTLTLLDNGTPIAEVLANRYRAGLDKAGIGNGRHAFKITIPGGLSPSVRHVIQVKRTRDGADIPGSPVVIEPADRFDEEMEQMVAGALAALDGEEARARALSFLIGQTDSLLQQHADAQGQRAERQAHRLFRRRWGPRAADMSEVADPGLRALVIDNRAPVRDRDAGSHVILSHMAALKEIGYRVSLVARDEMELDPAVAATLAANGVTVCGSPFYGSAEDVLRRQQDCFDLIYLHRPENASRYLELARGYHPRARILYSVADLHHLRLERQAKVEARPELIAIAERMRMIEFMAAWRADAVITHSADEAALLRRAIPKAQVNVVPWAVASEPTRVPFARRKGVAFIGGYGHRPNPDAAHWLIEQIMPAVWRTDPDIQCLLVGAEMPEALSRLAGDRVLPVGHVADLAADIFTRVRLTVAPLRFGAGVKGKVLESLAAGVPCAMSPIAAEGLRLPAVLRATVGENAEALAASICRLHGDAAANRAAADAGLEFVRREFSAETTVSALRAAIEGKTSPDLPGDEPA